MAKNMATSNKFGIFISCEIICQGSSIRLFLLEILMMVGTVYHVIRKDETKEKTILI